MNSILYKQFEQDAVQWVEEAGKILIDQEQSFTIATQKDVLDVATSADIAVEEFLTNKILEKYPDHGILGEESDNVNNDARYCWIIDPLDGTKEYVRGMGEYNLLVAVEDNKSVVTGVIKRFGHSVIYTCSQGNGSYMDKKVINVSKISSFEKAIIGTNLPIIKNSFIQGSDSIFHLIKTIMNESYRLRPGSDDAKMVAWVAQGAYDAYISFPKRQKWWDVAPALLLVEEAGGKVTNWEGDPIINHDLSKGILVSNGLLHEQLLNIVKAHI